MPATRVWGLSWAEANAGRDYPLAAGSSATSRDGGFAVPNDLLVGLHLPLPAWLGVSPGEAYLGRLTAAPDGFSLAVMVPAEGGEEEVAVATVAAAGHAFGAAYPLAGVGRLAGAVGWVQVGRFDGLAAAPAGDWGFDPAAARLDPDCGRVLPVGVRGLAVVDAGDRSVPLDGVVALVAGANARLAVSGGAVRVDFVGPDGTVAAGCDCGGGPLDPRPCVKSVGGVEPDENGNVGLVGRSCLSVSAGSEPGQLVLDDTCAQPCCGCPELELLLAEVSRQDQEWRRLAGATELIAAQAGAARDLALADRGACQP